MMFSSCFEGPLISEIFQYFTIQLLPDVKNAVDYENVFYFSTA